MLFHRDIARALLIDAYADLEAARVLRQAGIYARVWLIASTLWKRRSKLR